MFFSWGRHAYAGLVKTRITVLRQARASNPRRKPVGGSSSGKQSSGSALAAGKIR